MSDPAEGLAKLSQQLNEIHYVMDRIALSEGKVLIETRKDIKGNILRVRIRHGDDETIILPGNHDLEDLD